MYKWIVVKLDNAVDKICEFWCGLLGHDYIREENGFVYCKHCGHILK